MKHSKLFALALAVALTLSMAITAFAASPGNPDDNESAAGITLTLKQAKASNLGTAMTAIPTEASRVSGLKIFNGQYLIYHLTIKNDTNEDLENYEAKINLPMLGTMKLVTPLGDMEDGILTIPVESIPANDSKAVSVILYAPAYKLAMLNSKNMVPTTHTDCHEVHATLTPEITDESTDMTGLASNTVKTLRTTIVLTPMPRVHLADPDLRK